MNVTLRQLSIFTAVAHRGSYTRAAESMFLSQPAVSQQIRQLEENLGIALFDTVGKRLELSPAGEELLRYATAIQRHLNEADEVIDQLKGLKGGKLSVSVASTANHFATRMLAVFAKQHPGTELSLQVRNRGGLIRELEENSCDLVIMGQPPKHKHLELEANAFMDNPLVIIAGREHPLVDQRRIPLSALADYTFVVRERDSGTRMTLERVFEDRKLTLNRGIELSQNEAIKQAVAAGLGLGIASLHTLELELETQRLEVLDVEGFPVHRKWHVVHRKGKRLSPLAEAFKRFAIEQGPSCANVTLDAPEAQTHQA